MSKKRREKKEPETKNIVRWLLAILLVVIITELIDVFIIVTFDISGLVVIALLISLILYWSR